jgi:hypothetical protein
MHPPVENYTGSLNYCQKNADYSSKSILLSQRGYPSAIKQRMCGDFPPQSPKDNQARHADLSIHTGVVNCSAVAARTSGFQRGLSET